MALIDSLVQLVRSLQKSEKRAFRLACRQSNYTDLFDIIDGGDRLSAQQIRQEFEKNHEGAFPSAVSYLYKTLLDVLLDLRENRDRTLALFNRIAKASVLFEKSMARESLDMLEDVRKEAAQNECYEVLLYASRLELEFLSFLNMPDISETELLEKQFGINGTLKHIQAVYEQSALYELLKHRIIYKGDVRSARQMTMMNDLVFSEHSIFMSSRDSLEARRRHLLFQSYYLMNVGNRRLSSQAFYELDTLYQECPQFKENPSLYYVSVIEGILASLRSLRKFEEMVYFIERLDGIADKASYFRDYLLTLSALYKLLFFLDSGDFESALGQMKDSGCFSPERHFTFFRPEIALYSALVHIGLGNYRTAGKILADGIFHGDSIYDLPIYRTLRLTRLIVHYEMADMEYVLSEVRSMKRVFAKDGKSHRMELLIFELVGGDRLRRMRRDEREMLWARTEPELCDIRKDVFEMQLLKIFDFTAYVESRICRVPLSETIRKNISFYSQE